MRTSTRGWCIPAAVVMLTAFAPAPQAWSRQGMPPGAASARVQPGPKQAPTPEIVLGTSTALTGPAAALGTGFKAGVDAAIDEANRAGGVGGATLRLIALDDGYEPTRTAPNMRRLVETEHVLAVIGNVGTPTAVAAIPIAMESHTPFVAAFTGAGVLRKAPPDRYVINYRASYVEETETMVAALVERAGLKPEEIGFFTQRDAYGDAGFAGGIAALLRHGLKSEAGVVHGRYERNTTAVENAVADVLSARTPVRAVIMVGAYKPTAAFVKLLRSTGPSPMFLSVSFVGSEALAAELGSDGDGVIITQVVPPPDSDVPVAVRHREALAAVSPEIKPTFTSLEGYVAGRILLESLRRVRGPLDRESLTASFESLGDFDVGLGESLRLSPTEHQACHHVWPTMLRAGRIVALDWKELTAGAPAPGRAEAK
jgi:branched-chain amino acid transport system substrate-binding protein